MITTARPRSWRSRSSSRSTRLRLETSSALTGSSQNSSRGRVDDRAGERHALPLAAGELARVAGRGTSRRPGRRGRRDSATRCDALAREGRRRRRAARATSSPTVRSGSSDAQRVLEHELHLPGAAEVAQRAAAQRAEVGARRSRCGPPAGRTRPTVARASVVLPDPVSPTMPRISPGRTSRSTSARAAPVPEEPERRRRRVRDRQVGHRQRDGAVVMPGPPTLVEVRRRGRSAPTGSRPARWSAEIGLGGARSGTASRQRGANRQPGSASPASGGLPGMTSSVAAAPVADRGHGQQRPGVRVPRVARAPARSARSRRSRRRTSPGPGRTSRRRRPGRG